MVPIANTITIHVEGSVRGCPSELMMLGGRFILLVGGVILLVGGVSTFPAFIRIACHYIQCMYVHTAGPGEDSKERVMFAQREERVNTTTLHMYSKERKGYVYTYNGERVNITTVHVT